MHAWQIAIERMRCGVARRIGVNIDLLKSAVSAEQLDPGSEVAGSPCIALPDQYDRVRACAFGVDVQTEIAQLKGAPRRVGATTRYVLHDVLVANGIIYGRGQRKYFNPEARDKGNNVVWREYDEVALRSSFLGCHFFGHWLRDDCATHMLAEECGTTMSMPTPLWPDQSTYRALFEQDYADLHSARIKRLVLFEDICQNAHKAKRFRILRDRASKNRKATASGHVVYIMRGAGGKSRPIVNEEEIVEALSRRGITIVRAEAISTADLVEALLGARIVISVEGSQLSHALFTLRDDGGVLVLQPPGRFFNSHMDWARALNMRYGIVVGHGRESGFHVPVDDLLRTLDLMHV